MGTRIRYWRRRRGGMSQRALADRAGVTQGFISQVESGTKSIDRRSTMVNIAKALQVTVADLLGQPGDPTDPNKALATMSVPEIRLALVEVDAGKPDPNQTREQVVAGLANNDVLRRVCDFATATNELPALLRSAPAYGPALASEALHATASVLRSLGYRDLAWRTSDMAMTQAREADDMLLLAACQFTRLSCLPPEAYAVIASQARSSYEELQPLTSEQGIRRGYGALHLAAALAEAQAGNHGQVDDHLVEARREAVTVGEPPYPGGLSMSFGPTNTELWAMSCALEAGEYRYVIEIARRVKPEALPHVNRQSSYWLDLGRAMSHIPGRDHEAIIAIAKAERIAPQYIRTQPSARNAVATLIGRARQRAVAYDLRQLADRMGLA